MDHFPWECLMWKALLCGSNTFFDSRCVVLCFRCVVLLSIREEAHLHVKVVLDLIHHTAVLTIAAHQSHHKPGVVVLSMVFQFALGPKLWGFLMVR